MKGRAVVRWSKIKREAILCEPEKMIRSSLKEREIITGECLKFQNGKKKMSESKSIYNRRFSFYEFYNPYLKLETTIRSIWYYSMNIDIYLIQLKIWKG